jgi:hypothetical protein
MLSKKVSTRATPETIALPAIGEDDGADAILASHRAIVEAVTRGNVSPAEGLELVAVIEAQRAAVEQLRPDAMDREPTPEELAEQKRRNEAIAKAYNQFQDNFAR